MTRAEAIQLTVALTLALHFLGSGIGMIWIVVFLSGSLCVGMLFGAMASDDD